MGPAYPRHYAQYVLLERLGTGGMSEVDLARKNIDDGAFVRFTVIKRIKADRATDESFVRMFKDEARITSELHHANIGAVYDFGKVDDEYYLALEYVPGVDVRFLVNTLRERAQRVPVKVALRIVVDVLEALDYAHAKKDTFGREMGIVHRDVNPRNVMLSIRGEVKLIDFGVAKASDRLEQTRADQVKGKYGYMAPEQITGIGVDHRTDVYAAGLLLHELLSGLSPFLGMNQVQILHRMVSGQVPDMPRVPELRDESRLREVHDKSLAESPEARYQTAGAFADGLRAVADTIGGLPTNDQLAAFLSAVDPELTNRLQRKMETYGKVTLQDVPRAPVDFDLPHDAETQELQGPIPEADSLSVTRTEVLAGSFVLVSMASAVVAVAVVTVGLVGAYLLFGGGPAAAPVPVPVLVAPEPLRPPEPRLVAPVAAPSEPTSRPPAEPVTRPEPVEPAPRSVQPREPIPEPQVGRAPDPEPEPVVLAPEPLPEPVPVVLPEPGVLSADVGYLNVTAPEKGQPVLVDDEQVGVTALQRYRLAVGTYQIDVPGYSCSPASVSVRRSQVVSVTCK